MLPRRVFYSYLESTHHFARYEDFRYALLLFAVEVVSFILDLKGGSQWGYLLASFLLSVLILGTTIYAYFIKRSRIKSEAQQLIAVEIVFSVLQLIISGYCLIKTLSGVKTNYGASVFPLANATISVVFIFKSKKEVSHSSSDAPSKQFGIVKDTNESELDSIRVDSLDTPVDNVEPADPTHVSEPTSDAEVDPGDPTHVSEPASDAVADPADPTHVSEPASDAEVDPADPTLVSGPASDAEVDPADPTLVSGPASDAGDAEIDPADPMHVSEPTSDRADPTLVSGTASDAEVDPADSTLVSGPASDAEVDKADPTLVYESTSDAEIVSVPTSSTNVPQANTLRQRRKQSSFRKLVLKMDLANEKAKMKALKTLSKISGVDSIQVDMKEKKLILIGDVDPVHVISILRKQQGYSELISVGPVDSKINE